MNVIFALVLTLSTFILIFVNPDAVLSSMLSGGEKALNLSLKMVVIYAVWLGIFQLMENSGLSRKVAKLFKPINRFLFGKLPDKANDYVSLNLSANFLGMSGATTPMGIRSIEELEKHPNTNYAICMFFVITYLPNPILTNLLQSKHFFFKKKRITNSIHTARGKFDRNKRPKPL